MGTVYVVVYSTSFKIPKYVIFGRINDEIDDVDISSITPNIGFEI
jgi:hypothetical protein